MAQTNYPYLDLTVLPELRPHVISSRAVLLFDAAFSDVLWANGEGASLLGSPALRDLLDSELRLKPTMYRQISAAIDQLDDEGEVSAVVRIRRGMQSRLLGFSVRHVELPENETAVLMVTESLHDRGHGETEMAKTAVDCLDGYSHASAIVDATGNLLAASEHFDALEVPKDELSNLTKEVSTEDDRLVKRLIKTANGSMAAGIARLSDNPASHILIIADPYSNEDIAIEASDPANEAEEIPAKAAADEDKNQEPEKEAAAEQAAPPAVGAFSNRRKGGTSNLARWYFKQPAEDAAEQSDDTAEQSANSADGEAAASEISGDSEKPSVEASADEAGAGSDSGLVQETEHTGAAKSKRSSRADGINSDSELDSLRADSDGDFEFTSGSKPIRFVWDMDTNDEFRSVSKEFEQAVGPSAANVVGLTWTELCQMYDIENGEEISDLLKKGDTWSGKTVLWPVEGTDLRVPIDLAGLPSYGRNRVFEGFNGFGIVRTADAVVDPKASGMKISSSRDDFGETPEDAINRSPDEKVDDSSVNDADKVVDLETRRDPKNERSLSSDEQETFEEIGEKLADEQNVETNKPDEKSANGKEADADFVPSAFSGPSRKSQKSDAHEDADAGKVNTPEHNVDTSILARLPIAVLVYRKSDLLFGNQQFFQQTGYDDLSELAKAGGIETLFGGATDENSNVQFTIYHANGKQLDAQANLQRVPWDEDRAMLLTLRHDLGHEDEDDPDKRSDKIGHNSGNTNDSRDVVDSSSSGSTSSQSLDTPSSSAKNTAEIVSLHGAKVLNEHQERPAFGGLGAEDLRDILDTATDGVIILSDEGIIRALNKSAEALFDVEPEAVLDQSFTKILAQESHRSVMDYLSGISGTGVASLINDGREIIGKTAKGGLIPLFITIGKLQHTDACCAVVRDITQWKKAEEELLSAKSIAESASAQKTEFLAKVSHEIRTPLNAIIGFSDMMIEERFGEIDNDRYRGYLRDIHRSGNHVLELVNDLLDISKIEAGKLELEFDACDLNTTVSETVALTQPDANKERIIIRTSLSAVVPKVVADPRSLRQIILNLVSNSIKYTRPGGQVIVSTVYEESGEVVLRVRDTGIGMTEVELTRALKPFQQINAETNTQGTGLGLPLTKALVEANRARFEIESTPEEGTLVEIFFPNQRVLADR